MRRRLRRHAHWGAILALLTSGFVAYKQTPTLVPRPAPVALASPLPPASSPVDGIPLASTPTHDCAALAPVFAAHTYHPQRLVVLKDCITIRGVVEVVRREPDGDDHVLVKLDPGFEGLTNSVNDSKQQGDLVIEPQCVLTVTQADAIGPCSGAPRPTGLELLTVGAHVAVTGPYVLDQQHGWNEIHSVLWVEKA